MAAGASGARCRAPDGAGWCLPRAAPLFRYLLECRVHGCSHRNRTHARTRARREQTQRSRCCGSSGPRSLSANARLVSSRETLALVSPSRRFNLHKTCPRDRRKVLLVIARARLANERCSDRRKLAPTLRLSRAPRQPIRGDRAGPLLFLAPSFFQAPKL